MAHKTPLDENTDPLNQKIVISAPLCKLTRSRVVSVRNILSSKLQHVFGVQQRLPGEIIDRIIAHLPHAYPDAAHHGEIVFESKDWLQKLCTSSPHFVHACQRKLFFLVDLCAKLDTGRERLHRFYRLLKMSPHLARYVKHLILPVDLLEDPRMVKILKCLVNLRSASIYNYAEAILSMEDSFGTLTFVNRLRRLELRVHTFADFVEFDTIIGSFPVLRELLLETVDFDQHTGYRLATKRGALVTLKTLELYAIPEDTVDAMLQALHKVDMTCLHALSVDRQHEDLFRRNVGTLRELTLHVALELSCPEFYSSNLSILLHPSHKLRRINLFLRRPEALWYILPFLGPGIRLVRQLSIAQWDIPQLPEIWAQLDRELAAVAGGLSILRVYLESAVGAARSIQEVDLRAAMPKMQHLLRVEERVSWSVRT
ncbi:unnamed protein product [Mycena citricolor]|uniref:Uncharacterized protein n=1 Tax=Mycena citricolor TaxID=2018698 RepID=A0AAD2HCT9_9AGAR|nr:unnamed protein product [Mycena citricolor]